MALYPYSGDTDGAEGEQPCLNHNGVKMYDIHCDVEALIGWCLMRGYSVASSERGNHIRVSFDLVEVSTSSRAIVATVYQIMSLKAGQGTVTMLSFLLLYQQSTCEADSSAPNG